MANALLTPVIDGVADTPARRVVVGYNWTAVQTDDSLGLAWSPRTVSRARTTARTGSYAGSALSDLAGLARSDNAYERSIGVAAANAHWNRPADRLTDGDGLDAAPGLTVVIGGFPNLEAKLPGARVLELDPETGTVDRARSADLLGNAEQVVMTASTLVNDTADLMLSMMAADARVTVVGPGTPLCGPLLGRRIRRLAGFIAVDRDATFQAVMEGAGARALKRFGRSVVLTD